MLQLRYYSKIICVVFWENMVFAFRDMRPRGCFGPAVGLVWSYVSCDFDSFAWSHGLEKSAYYENSFTKIL